MDCRAKPGNDKIKKESIQNEKMISSFPCVFSCLSFPGLTGESIKEMSGSSPNMTVIKKESEHDYKEKEDEHDIEKAPQMRGWEISEAYFSAEANFFLSAEANILL